MSASETPYCGIPAWVFSILAAITGLLESFCPVSGSIGPATVAAGGVLVAAGVELLLVVVLVLGVVEDDVVLVVADAVEVVEAATDGAGAGSSPPQAALTSNPTVATTARAARGRRMHIPFDTVTRSRIPRTVRSPLPTDGVSGVHSGRHVEVLRQPRVPG